ncbi:hypothetical protein [Hyphomicrobium methylovorum]|uniref:hypothetical protein n=1 Tax=Hyphomicrobium methylovorum TaxID=84 RepID=UPI001FE91BB9|nr:hypothetical protein [Hyphomicrobium methylovorum]
MLADIDRGGGFALPDHGEKLSEAHNTGFQLGLAAGRVEAEADCELRLAELETRHLEMLAQQREGLQRDYADALADRFDGAVKMIERAIEERVANLLQPWLVERLRARAIEDLEKAIVRALSEGAKVHIEAPPTIVAHLRDRLPNTGLQIEYSESQTADIRAHIEDTQIEANLSVWISELEAAAE